MTNLEDDLAAARRWYAEDLRIAAGVRSKSLIDAFASVPRERFVGPAPWHILSPRIGGIDVSALNYQTIVENDPRILYHDILVALDKERQINNGQPSFWAVNFDSLNVATGEDVLHVGCGTGYYSAVLAEMAGPNASVVAVEVDDALAARADAALSAWRNVSVKKCDGATYDAGPVDAIVVNAGVTHPLALWLDRLKPGGRMLLPLTTEGPRSGAGLGAMFLVTRLDTGFALRAVCPTAIINFAGARDARANAQLLDAFQKKRDRLGSLKSLRRDPHAESAECWLHGDGFCLSTAEPGTVH